MRLAHRRTWVAGATCFTLLSCLILPAASRAQTCTADCDGNGAVTVNEIVTVLNIGLGNRPLADCRAGDSSGDGLVTVDEIVAGLNFALVGCPSVGPSATPTTTASPSPTPSTGETLRIDLGGGSGLAGSVVGVPITLSNSGGNIIATSNDITYDSALVRVAINDGPDCRINPAIGEGTVPGKMILATVLPAAGSFETLRVGVISFINANPIPDGLICTCHFRIPPAASPAEVVLSNLPGAALPDGTEPEVTGSDGVITIR